MTLQHGPWTPVPAWSKVASNCWRMMWRLRENMTSTTESWLNLHQFLGSARNIYCPWLNCQSYDVSKISFKCLPCFFLENSTCAYLYDDCCMYSCNFLGNPKMISGAVRGKVPSGVSYDRALPRELADGLLGLGDTSHGFFCVFGLLRLFVFVCWVDVVMKGKLEAKMTLVWRIQCRLDRFDVKNDVDTINSSA